MLRIIRFRVPFYYTLLLCAGIACITYFFSFKIIDLNGGVANGVVSTAMPTANDFKSNYKIQRLSGYNYISPLMFINSFARSSRYQPLCQEVSAYIGAKKQNNDIADAAFYLKDLETTEWTGYNEEIKYYPGSLMKVPVLISYLHLEEDKPGLLNKTVTYTTPENQVTNPAYISRQIQPGHTYTIKELLRYMIAYSDNHATDILDKYLQMNVLNKTLTDHGFPEIKPGEQYYKVSARDYSVFLNAICNAAYLTIPHSEYAAELLNASDFKQGFAKGFPPGFKMIHKFGESGTAEEKHLSESGIVYINNKPFVLTIMTKGADLNKLANTISNISAMVYSHISR